MIDPFNPPVREDFFFGEIVIHDAYEGIMTYDVDGVKGWQKYDDQNPAHQKAIATPKPNGKQRQTSIVYEIQHFPIGTNFETWINQWVIWGDEWKGFVQSLADLNGLQVKKDQGELYGTHVRALTERNNFFQYKTPTVRTYQGQDGSTKEVRGLQVVKRFETLTECQKAYESNLDGVLADAASSVETEPEPPTVDRETALKFIPAMANKITNQQSCWVELQAAIDEVPALNGLKVDEKDVAQAAYEANPKVFELPF